MKKNHSRLKPHKTGGEEEICSCFSSYSSLIKASSSGKIDEHIVLIGGGSGVYQVARYLKYSRQNISTVQTMFDHGGHSGELRDELGILPPGDIRRAILALSDDNLSHRFRNLLTYRKWPKESKLGNAVMGNLIFAAYCDLYGGPIAGIRQMCEMFQVKGKVLPVTLDQADLCALFSDGSRICGEDKIDTRSPDDDKTISSVYLSEPANLYTGAHEAILSADKIVFCPGDLYTSVIPNTLVNGFHDAIRCTNAKLIYVVNIMTKKSETPGFAASQFTETLLGYLGCKRFDTVIANSGVIRSEILESYAEEKSKPVHLDVHRLKKFTRRIVTDDIVSQGGGVIRHSPKVSKIIANL